MSSWTAPRSDNPSWRRFTRAFSSVACTSEAHKIPNLARNARRAALAWGAVWDLGWQIPTKLEALQAASMISDGERVSVPWCVWAYFGNEYSSKFVPESLNYGNTHSSRWHPTGSLGTRGQLSQSGPTKVLVYLLRLLRPRFLRRALVPTLGVAALDQLVALHPWKEWKASVRDFVLGFSEPKATQNGRGL